MTTLNEQMKQARHSRDFSALVQAIPYARFLGITVDASGAEVIATMRYREYLIGNAFLPALHGGTTGALLESIAIFTLLLETEMLPKTINITIEYLRTGKPLDTLARAEFSKLGRRVASVHAYAWQEQRDKPIASATANFLLRQDAPII